MSILFYLYNLTREKKFDEIIEKYSIDKDEKVVSTVRLVDNN